MITQLSIETFVRQTQNELTIDVRTPAEFEQGHIVHAINIPLFTNEERVLVGTCYKQNGRQAAILLGFELIGSRWAQYIRDVSNHLDSRNHQFVKDESQSTINIEELKKSQKVFVHCWRGGMRSGAMAWALHMYGFDVYVLTGGYKKYRQLCLSTLNEKYSLIVLSGKTGCAKTDTLHEIKKLGEQIIDLEALAHHQGSSFGSKGNPYQPTQEQFENCLAHELLQLNRIKRIWIENESIVIGRRVIPAGIFAQMRQAHIINMVLPIEERVEYLNNDYGRLEKTFLKEAVNNISKRLGPNETKLTLQAIDEGRMKDFIAQVLVYYDKTYMRSQEKREKETIHQLMFEKIDPFANAKAVIKFCNELNLGL